MRKVKGLPVSQYLGQGIERSYGLMPRRVKPENFLVKILMLGMAQLLLLR